MTLRSATLSQAALNTAGLSMQGSGLVKVNGVGEHSTQHSVSSLSKKRKEKECSLR